MSHAAFYQDQAERAQALAEQTNLPNVRARFAESAQTWRRLMERAERLEALQAASTAATGAPGR